MKSKNLLFIIFIFLTIIGCSKKHNDPFYNDIGTWDSSQLPLLKPYYLIYITDEFGWQMPIRGNFPEPYYDFNLGDITNIEKVSVENEVIMVYSSEGRKLSEDPAINVFNWFVMVPSQSNSEMAFSSEEDLLNYIKQFDITIPAWVEPRLAYKIFSRTGCYDWIPDCEK